MWRAMNSLLVLRDQCNQIAPNRVTGADGLVGDAAHQDTNSDHNPHPVAGVGPEIVTALDLTHDPAHGFDSYLFAECLRLNRDKRLKYVISNGRVFNSSTWTWHTYVGTDPHTGHVHVSVLDAVISDTRTPWNLDGFEDDMTPSQQYVLHVINYRIAGQIAGNNPVLVPAFTATDGSKFPALSSRNVQLEAILAGQATLSPEQLAELAAAIAEQVDTTLDFPTAQENADAVLDAEAARLAE